MNENTRLHELDSLRALAAIGVIGWHYTGHFGASPMPYFMVPFYHHGLLLVDFFFVLSGFVVARVYWAEGRSTAVGQNLKERIARMYPLHLATLCAVACMQWVLVHTLSSPPFVYAFNDKYDFALNLLLLNRTGLERGFSFNGPSWSISTEFVVNVLFLMIIALPRKFAQFSLMALFACSTAIVLSNGLISHQQFGGIIDNDIFRTTVGFIAGVATYRGYVRFLSRVHLKPAVADVAAMLSLVAVLGYCAGQHYSGYSDLGVTLVLFPALIVATTQSRTVKRVLTISPLVYLGTISYSIYLVHFPLQLGLHMISVALDIRLPYERAYFLGAFFLGTIALASLTYYLVEKPGKKYIKAICFTSRQTNTIDPTA